MNVEIYYTASRMFCLLVNTKAESRKKKFSEKEKIDRDDFAVWIAVIALPQTPLFRNEKKLQYE